MRLRRWVSPKPLEYYEKGVSEMVILRKECGFWIASGGGKEVEHVFREMALEHLRLAGVEFHDSEVVNIHRAMLLLRAFSEGERDPEDERARAWEASATYCELSKDPNAGRDEAPSCFATSRPIGSTWERR